MMHRVVSLFTRVTETESHYLVISGSGCDTFVIVFPLKTAQSIPVIRGGGVRKMRGPANELEQFVISIIFTGFFNWTPGLFLRWVATFFNSLIDLLLTPPPPPYVSTPPHVCFHALIYDDIFEGATPLAARRADVCLMHAESHRRESNKSLCLV